MFTPDSKRLLTITLRGVSPPPESLELGEVLVHDVATGNLLHRIALPPHQGLFGYHCYSVGDDTLVVAGRREVATVYDLKTGKALGDLPGDPRLQRIALSRDGQWLFSLDKDNGLCVWDVKRQKLERTLPEQARRVQAIAISADGKWCAAVNDYNELVVYDRATGKAKAQAEMLFQGAICQSLLFTADGKTLLATGKGIHYGVHLWDWQTSKQIRGGLPPRGNRHIDRDDKGWNPSKMPLTVSMTADGTGLFFGGDNSGVFFMDLRDPAAVAAEKKAPKAPREAKKP